MKRLVSILSVVVLWPLTASWAQLYAPNAAGVSMAQVHTIVRDMEAAKKFWILIGGTPIKVDGTEVIKFPGALVFLTPGQPTGGSNGTSVDHVGIWEKGTLAYIAKLKTAGVKMDPETPITTPGRVGVGYVYSPDNLRVEIEYGSNPSMVHGPSHAQVVTSALKDSQAAFDHIHFSWPAPLEAQAWYGKMFGAQEPWPTEYNLKGGPTFPEGRHFTDLAGTRLNLGKAPTAPATGPVVPTKGRALDYIGFEVKDLEAFCKKLEAKGVKFDQPYSKSRHKSFASAQLTDPWGASIELTEGLNRF